MINVTERVYIVVVITSSNSIKLWIDSGFASKVSLRNQLICNFFVNVIDFKHLVLIKFDVLDFLHKIKFRVLLKVVSLMGAEITLLVKFRGNTRIKIS